jgi:hypothetical protein
MLRWCCIAVLLCLGGCATTNGYRKLLDGWMGADERSLVRAWGVPQRTYETGGVKYLAFISSREVSSSRSQPVLVQDMVNDKSVLTYTPSAPRHFHTLSCETTFEITRGRVTSWRFSGNDCTAAER